MYHKGGKKLEQMFDSFIELGKLVCQITTQYKVLQRHTNKQTLQLECIMKSLTRNKKSYKQLKQKHIVLYRRRSCQLMSKKRGSTMHNEICKGENRRNELGRDTERGGVPVLKLTEGKN